MIKNMQAILDLMDRPSTGSGTGEYYLDTLAVLPEYRRRGIAAGYDLITLVVDSNMPDLIRLYESVGFLRMTYSVKRQNAKL